MIVSGSSISALQCVMVSTVTTWDTGSTAHLQLSPTHGVRRNLSFAASVCVFPVNEE